MSTFRKKTRLYKVYHIREKGNLDVNEGYVGVTRRSLAMRLGQHMNSPRPVGNKLRKIGKDAVEIYEIVRLPKDQALRLEYFLRGDRNVGWNIMAGGNRPTVVCQSCGKHLPKRTTGAMCEKCNPCKFTNGHRPHNYGKGETYELTSPDGQVFIPEAFTHFCKEYDLTPQNLRKVAKGKRKHHKGWIAKRVTKQAMPL